MFKGGGVLLIENHNNQKGRIEPSVILFKNKYTNIYSDLGGRIDPKDNQNISKTALREAFEESLCLIKLRSVRNFDSVSNNSYKCYIVPVEDNKIKIKYYYHNLKVIPKLDIPEYYKETIDMARFYISDLMIDGLMKAKKSFKTHDTNKNGALISNRAIDVIKKTISMNMIHSNLIKPIKLKKTITDIKGSQVITLFN